MYRQAQSANEKDEAKKKGGLIRRLAKKVQIRAEFKG